MTLKLITMFLATKIRYPRRVSLHGQRLPPQPIRVLAHAGVDLVCVATGLSLWAFVKY
jgi:hypothetical protein